jgi:tetratricopeptide (TPR) repeat protein
MGGLPWLRVAAAAALLLAISAAAALSARRLPALSAGWTWYLVTLLPVIGLVQVGAQARADRYTYLPFVGMFIALAWAAAAAPVRYHTAAAAAATAAVAALAAAAWFQAGVWRDNASLWTHTARATAGNVVALNNLATALIDERDRPAEALPVLREALRISPDDADARYNLGLALLRLGRSAEARVAFEEALALTPADADARYMLGLALLRLGRHREAAGHFETVLAKDPDYKDARIQLAIARAKAEAGAMAATPESREHTSRMTDDTAAKGKRR